MLPVQAHAADSNAVVSDDVLAVIAFLTSVPGSVQIPLRPLGELSCEVWRSELPVTRFSIGDVSAASNGAVMLGSVAGDLNDTEATYDKILEAMRIAGYPRLLRVWNHVGGINECEATLERYRHFCVGRHAALTKAGFARERFPSASAVGMPGRGLAVYFLASRSESVQLENPRQIAAYDYPPSYGPRSPSFSRATVADGMLFVSGTSSVVGHETRHPGDIEAQVKETLCNLDRIIRTAGSSLENLQFVKTYIRRAADYDVVRSIVEAALPHTRGLYLESDICRRDLLVEIEGIVTKLGG